MPSALAHALSSGMTFDEALSYAIGTLDAKLTLLGTSADNDDRNN